MVADTGVPYWPQTLSPNTVVGRLGTSPGPTEEIPFAVLTASLPPGPAGPQGDPGPIGPTGLPGPANSYRKCVKDYGAIGDGSIADDGAINATIAAETEVLFTSGTYRISANVTWAAGKVYRFVPGARITVDGGVTLTIRGLVDAPPKSLFIGSGTVLGVAKCFAEWFGAVRNGSTDDAPAITKMIASVQASPGSDMVEQGWDMLSGTYALASTITFTESATVNWHIRGAGSEFTILKAKASFTGTSAMVFQGPTSGADYLLTGFSIKNTASATGPTNGLKLGQDSGALEGVHASAVTGVQIAGFPVNWYLRNLRLVTFLRCSGWASDDSGEVANLVCFRLTATASAFIGDMQFTDCQAVGCGAGGATPSGIDWDLTDEGRNAVVISGIRWNSCVNYGALTQLNMSLSGTSSVIGDIWWNPGCQFEAPAPGGTSTGILINISHGSRVTSFKASGLYMVGNGFLQHINAAIGATGGSLDQLDFSSNYMNGPKFEFIAIRGTNGTGEGIVIHSNRLRGPLAAGNAATAVYIENCSEVSCIGNVMTPGGGGTRTSIVKFSGGNYLLGKNNIGAGLTTVSLIENTGVGGNTDFTGNV